MSYDIGQIRAGLAAALKPLVDAGALTLSSPYALSSPTPPCAMVLSGPTRYDEAMGGGADGLTFTVAVLVGAASELSSQQTLDTFLARGATSVKALLQANRTLHGVCQDLRVTEASGQRPYTLDSASGAQTPPLLGCEWTVEVIA